MAQELDSFAAPSFTCYSISISAKFSAENATSASSRKLKKIAVVKRF